MFNLYQYKVKKTDQLIAYANNARTHSDYQIKQIMNSINEFGFTNPILIDGNDEIIAGHGRVLAAMGVNMSEVPCIVVSGLSAMQKKALVIADNQLALNAGWDEEILKGELLELQDNDYDLELLGLSGDELDDLLIENEESEEIEPEIKFSDELLEEHNYVVLYFSNDMDWLSAKTHFNLETVSSKRSNGKEWSKGVGRVVDGAEYLSNLKV